MTAKFYNDLRDGVVEELLTEFGKDYVLQQEGSAAVFDEPTGFITTPGTPTNHTVTGVLTSYNQREINGTSILATDFKLLLSPSGMTVVPDTSMKIVDGIDEFTIIHVKPLRPGGVDVLYELQVR